MFQQSVVFSGTSSNNRKFDYSQNSDYIQHSQISGDILNPSRREELENLLLRKQDKTEQQLRVSYGQIECSSKGSYGSATNENLQNARAVTAVSLFTLILLRYRTIQRSREITFICFETFSTVSILNIIISRSACCYS